MQDPKMALPNGIDPKAFPSPVPFDLSTVPGALEALERDGVCHIPGVLNAEWLAYLRDCTEWQIEHPHVWASPGVVSGLYDYIQRSVWTTNEAFAQFMYRSPIGSVLAAVGQTPEIRITTDLLMVNPNKGFKWHQDNQNGPVEFESALRWWVTMDETPPDHGAPVYLAGSQNNDSVDPLQVRAAAAPTTLLLLLLRCCYYSRHATSYYEPTTQPLTHHSLALLFLAAGVRGP